MRSTIASVPPVALDPEIAGKRLLILGAGLWQVEYIRHARRLGADTWVTDWSPTAVGKPESDHFEPIDVKNVEETLAYARRVGVDGVLTAAEIGVSTAAYVAARLGLPGYSEALAIRATNKLKMRQRCEAVGILGPSYHAVRSVAEAVALPGSLTLPVIVKPVDNCASRGVRYVEAEAEIRPAVEDALFASRSGEALIEQFLIGTEGSIEALVQEGQITILGICDTTKSPLPYRYNLELRYPGAFDEPTLSEIAGLPARIARGFGLVNGILHIEFLVSAEGRRVYLIEFAVRGCGTNVATHLMPRLTGIDVVRVLIRQAFGLTTAIERTRHLHGILHFLMFPPGRVVAVRGLDEARRVPGVIGACLERTPGDRIEDVRDGRGRPGHLLTFGETFSDARNAVARARALVRLDYEHATDVAAV